MNGERGPFDGAHDGDDDSGRRGWNCDIDVDAVVLQLLDIAADPERPMPHRHMAVAEVRDLSAGRVDPHVAAGHARLWRNATMPPEIKAETRRAVPTFWTQPVLPPSVEVRRMQRRRATRRWLAAVCGAGGRLRHRRLGVVDGVSLSSPALAERSVVPTTRGRPVDRRRGGSWAPAPTGGGTR